MALEPELVLPLQPASGRNSTSSLPLNLGVRKPKSMV